MRRFRQVRQPVFVLFLTEAFFGGFSWLPDAAAPVPAPAEAPVPVLASDNDAGGFVSGEETPSEEPPAPVESIVKLVNRCRVRYVGLYRGKGQKRSLRFHGMLR